MTRRSLLFAAPAALSGAEIAMRGRDGAGRLRFAPDRAALVICDMWDRHWCRGATERGGVLAYKISGLATVMRKGGATIIHAPSDTMGFYADSPARQAAMKLAKVEPPAALSLPDPKLPIDDSDGGCDTDGDKMFKAWSRQHPAIPIEPGDLITDNGREVYAALQAKRCELLFVAGVHTNMCILNRSFAIKQMTRWGVRCVLVRDLTDAMYDPKDAPYVSHERGTELVVEFIEKNWCPTVLSGDITGAYLGR